MSMSLVVDVEKEARSNGLVCVSCGVGKVVDDVDAVKIDILDV